MKKPCWEKLSLSNNKAYLNDDLLSLSQDLNDARGDSNVCLYKHRQFVRAVIEGKVDFHRLVRAEDMRRIEQIYYPALDNKERVEKSK